MAMCGNTKMALCSIPLASLCVFTPTHLPLAHSTPILCGLKVLERSEKGGQIATPQQMVQQCVVHSCAGRGAK